MSRITNHESRITGIRPLAAKGGCSDAPRIGLVAGWGRYPVVVARALKLQGYEVHCLGIKDHAEAVLEHACDTFAWIGLGKLGRAIRFFRERGVHHATMAGKVHKVRLFQRWTWWKHLPDWRTVRCFYPHFVLSRQDRKDDTLLKTIVDEFSRGGIRFQPATDYVPELLVKFGQLTSRGPTQAQRRDIEFGWTMAKEMGRLDIGQSVAVKDRATIAVEAIEGTDECIQRAGALCQAGGFTVVKVAKPQQDMRFDVPTIGLGTLRTMAAAGGRVLAVEAGRTIIIDQEEVIDFANQHKLVVVAFEESGQWSVANGQQAPGDC